MEELTFKHISANEFAKNFTAKDYEDLIDSVTYKYKVYSRMPEFESDFNMLMNKTLMNLGAEDIFDAGKADLSGITGAPGDIFVSKVIHKTHIEVDAKGTRASAVTVVTMEKNAVMETEEEYKILSDYSQRKNQTITKSLKEAIHLLFKREGSL